MKKFLLVLIAFVVFSSHDMYLKLDTYFLQPNTSTAIKLFNGTFDKSENVIDRNRMTDVSLVGNGTRSTVDTTQWSEKDNMTILSLQTGEPGTWVAGVSTRARNIEMTAEDFNGYLEHDGVLDMLEWRKENDALGKDAVEKYSKHVKTIFQVGDKKTDDWQTVLGYPIEFIPLSNPYDIHAGHDLKVKLLWQGEPLANQLISIDSEEAEHGHSHDHEATADAEHEHSDEHEHEHEHEDGHEHDHEGAGEHDHDDEHEHTDGAGHDHDDEHDHEDGADHDHDDEAGEDHHHHGATQVRTDANGNFTVKLASKGIWYLRTIYLTHSEEAGLTHESNWATLTFEVGEGDGHHHADAAHSDTEGGHTHADGTHHDDHDHEDGEIPSYVFWIGSIALLGGLFFWFNRKSDEIV